MPIQPRRRVFTVDELLRMDKFGIFHPEERIELINGAVYEMAPVEAPHASIVSRLLALVSRIPIKNRLIRIQSPIQLDDHNLPQPDMAILEYRDDYYKNRHPLPHEIPLVVEVSSDSTLVQDRQVKLPLYARAGIPEAWLIDVENGTITQFLNPTDNLYSIERRLQRGDRLESEAVPGLVLAVDEVLG